MDNFLIPACIAVAITIGILFFDIYQKKRLKKVLRQSSNTEPLLMQQSAGKKLNALQQAITQLAESGDLTIHEKLNVRLQETVNAYHSGKLGLPEYTNRLEGMLTHVQKRRMVR
jgi:hypothetical protein